MTSYRQAGVSYRSAIGYNGDDIPPVTTGDYGFVLNGLQMGPGTSYEIVDPEGVFSHDVRGEDWSRPNDHGAFPTWDFLTARKVTMQIRVRGTAATLAAKLDALATACSPSPVIEDVLEFQLPTAGKRRLYGRPRRYAVVSRNWRQGWATAAVEFYCPDPRLYSSAEHSTQGTMGSNTLTLTVPNNGSFTTPWMARMNGPLTAPSIKKGGVGLSFSSGQSIASGHYVLFDAYNRRVLLDGVTDCYWQLNPAVGITWFDLATGNNSVVFASSSGNTQCTINNRDAFL